MSHEQVPPAAPDESSEAAQFAARQIDLLGKLLWEAQRNRANMTELLADQKVQAEALKKLLWEAQTNRKSMDVVRTQIAGPVLDSVSDFARRQQYGFVETMQMIAEPGTSFARFGDGELGIMLRPTFKLAFQRNEEALRNALRGLITQPPDSLLLGFPVVYRDAHWSRVWCDLAPMLTQGRMFGNSHVSRPVFFENERSLGRELWRRVWEQRNVCVITGQGSRFELHPELFDNVKSAQVLYSTPRNAFSDLPRILKESEKPAMSDIDVFLIALGPAGTVLAGELASRGRKALDIGHVSDSYVNVFHGGAWPEQKSIIS